MNFDKDSVLWSIVVMLDLNKEEIFCSKRVSSVVKQLDSHWVSYEFRVNEKHMVLWILYFIIGFIGCKFLSTPFYFPLRRYFFSIWIFALRYILSFSFTFISNRCIHESFHLFTPFPFFPSFLCSYSSQPLNWYFNISFV